VNEALRSAEQTVMDRAKKAGLKPAHKIRAARRPELWRVRHGVELGKGQIVKRAGSKLLGSGVVGVLFQAVMAWRQQKADNFIQAPYVLLDEYGAYSLQQHTGPVGGLFGSKYFKNYKEGPLGGNSMEINEEEFQALKEEARALYGYIDWWGDFVPGLLNRSLPVKPPEA
jgi:hypothetical protein